MSARVDRNHWTGVCNQVPIDAIIALRYLSVHKKKVRRHSAVSTNCSKHSSRLTISSVSDFSARSPLLTESEQLVQRIFHARLLGGKELKRDNYPQKATEGHTALPRVHRYQCLNYTFLKS